MIKSICGGIVLMFLAYIFTFITAMMFYDFSRHPNSQSSLHEFVKFPMYWSIFLAEIFFPQTYEKYAATEWFTCYFFATNLFLYSVIAGFLINFYSKVKIKKTFGEPPNPPAF